VQHSNHPSVVTRSGRQWRHTIGFARVQAQQFVLDNICFSPLPVARWPALTLAPPAVPSSCPDLLLTFDDVALGELCVLMTLVPVLKANIAETSCLSYSPNTASGYTLT